MKLGNIRQFRDKLKIENALYIMQVLAKELQMKMLKQHDKYFASDKKYQGDAEVLVPLKLEWRKLNLDGFDLEKVDELCRMYLNHRFDLLGSGWIQVSYKNNAKGFDGYRYDVPDIVPDEQGEFLKELINKKNLDGSLKVWSKLDAGYIPIDWQKDFISGYRWKNMQWYRPQMAAELPGGDIKVPWELSRMQHLPRLAIFYHLLPDRQKKIKAEFRNQLLDFIATNPVRYGVNYVCTMDVGIRTANVALAYSLLRCQGVTFDAEFERILCGFMFEQCNHIRNNLEWSKFLTSNHYFANIAGLLWGSAILPKGKLRAQWLYFAADEINKEILKQFHEEGSNGEGSTAYHRLTSEMAIYSLALMKYLNRQGEHILIDVQALTIIKKAGDFTNAILRPDMMFTQIGDNDSGLFFRLSITGELITAKIAKMKYFNLSHYIPENIEELYLDENMNDARTFLASVYGMYGDNALLHAKEAYPLETSLVAQLVGEKLLIARKKEVVSLQNNKLELKYHSAYEIPSNGLNLLDKIERIDYPQFGIYLFKGKNIYLCVNASDNGQKGNAGHAHNDKLSFELFVGDQCIYEDSGTYVYTAMPEIRNEFRSTQRHNTIYVGMEQNEYNGLFSMNSRTKCELLDVTEHSIKLQCVYSDIVHIREIWINKDKVMIEDSCNHKFTQNFEQRQVTRGYGKIVNI